MWTTNAHQVIELAISGVSSPSQAPLLSPITAIQLRWGKALRSTNVAGVLRRF